MATPFYIGLEEARAALADIGIQLTIKQLRRAADPDATGRRKLPFFVDPIDGRLKIDRDTLLAIYLTCQAQAERQAYITPVRADKTLDVGPRMR
jgi:hypothetical protein